MTLMEVGMEPKTPDALLACIVHCGGALSASRRGALLMLVRECLIDIIELWQEYGAVAASEWVGPDPVPWSEQYQANLRGSEDRVLRTLKELGVVAAPEELDVSGLRQGLAQVRRTRRPADVARAIIRHQEHRLAMLGNGLAGIGDSG